MVHIQMVYFGRSGKYYSEGEGDYKEELFDGCIYPREYARVLRELKMLPGLVDGVNWNGFLEVRKDGGYPELLIPEDLI